jgi:hypothetical protein
LLVVWWLWWCGDCDGVVVWWRLQTKEGVSRWPPPVRDLQNHQLVWSVPISCRLLLVALACTDTLGGFAGCQPCPVRAPCDADQARGVFVAIRIRGCACRGLS